MNSEKPIIHVRNLKKNFQLYSHPVDRLKEVLHPRRKRYHHNFSALDNINLDIFKGEIVGIIGTNGSGKSTLLKILTGVLAPSSGNVEVNGRIAALLELGAGFNPELTGHENIFLNGALMGYSEAEMQSKVTSIIEFAEIGEFIYQPVKMYSSGMFARLAFAVSVNVNPDIMIVDEALSVGDMKFQERSYTKIKEMVRSGTTVIFVTHSLNIVRNFCSRAIWLNEGKLIQDEASAVVCEAYEKFMKFGESQISESASNHMDIMKRTQGSVEVIALSLDKNEYALGEDINLNISLSNNAGISQFGVGILIHDSHGRLITVCNSIRSDILFSDSVNKISLTIPENDFTFGEYQISISICDEKVMFSYCFIENVIKFRIVVPSSKAGISVADGIFRAKHVWQINE